MKRAIVFVLALVALALAGRGFVSAQAGVQVSGTTAQLDFPNGINFSITGSAPAAVSEARFNYRIAPDGVHNSAIAPCDVAGASFTCNYTLESKPNLLIPKADITYSWTFEAGDASQDTSDQNVTYEDTRYQWKSATQGNMTLWYYSGSESDARSVLQAGYDSEQKSSTLLQTTVDYPVKIIYYATADEMQPAIHAENDEGVITLGEVVYSDSALVSADYFAEDVARHEVAHVVQKALLRGAYNAPDWVLEGMAVYEQSQPIGGQRDAIESAIDDNTVLSVRSMSSASLRALNESVFLFYGEAWSLVKFLVETYGQQKFADYFHAINTGAGQAGALQQVYGFNQDGLENAWRDSVGLPPRTAPTPQDVNSSGPTRSNPSPSSNTNDTGSNVGLIAAVIVVTALIAGSLLALGVVLARRLG